MQAASVSTSRSGAPTPGRDFSFESGIPPITTVTISGEELEFEFSLRNVYLDINEAEKNCEKLQKERGHVIVPQKEYDELLDIKNKYNELKKP